MSNVDMLNMRYIMVIFNGNLSIIDIYLKSIILYTDTVMPYYFSNIWFYSITFNYLFIDNSDHVL